ncbi:hypothetical protein AAC387_Pa05g0391 [Persea americana]
MTLLRLPSVRLQLFHKPILFLFFISQRAVVVDGQVPIPPKYDGFVYRKSHGTESIVVEAFFDPLCPDSRDAWPPLKQALTYYVSNRCSLSLIAHPFPLPSIVASSLQRDRRWIEIAALSLQRDRRRRKWVPEMERDLEMGDGQRRLRREASLRRRSIVRG